MESAIAKAGSTSQTKATEEKRGKEDLAQPLQMTSPSLCSDVIFEILTRVSLKSLDTCKAVSKEWRNITRQSNFMPMYCERTNNLSGYYLQDLAKYKYVSKFVSVNGNSEGGEERLPEDMQILATSNQGIMCCLRRTGRRHVRYHVCKPTTKQWQILPNPKTRFATKSVGLMVLRARPLRFKIFRISDARMRLPKHNHYRFEIFDSEIWGWRESKYVVLPEGAIFESRMCVNAGGSLYLHTSNDQVLAFDEGSESWSTTQLPQSLYFKHKQLMEYQGRLGCMVEESEQCLDLWVLENGFWRKDKTMIINPAFYEDMPTSIPVVLYNGDVALMKTFYKVIFYKSQNHCYEVVKLHDFMSPRECFPFRSDFEPVDFKGRCPTSQKTTIRRLLDSMVSWVLEKVLHFDRILT